MSADFSPHAEDGQQIAIDQANSQFIQQADLIATKVEENGVISAINQSAEMIEISAEKINLTGAVTADSISSLAGLDVGNGQFVVDGAGNVFFGGTLNGATGLFSGELSTNTDIHVGQNIYLKMETGIERFTNKGIIFYEKEGQSLKTKITGDYLTLDIECTNRIRVYTELLDINSPKIWIDGQLDLVVQKLEN